MSLLFIVQEGDIPARAYKHMAAAVRHAQEWSIDPTRDLVGLQVVTACDTGKRLWKMLPLFPYGSPKWFMDFYTSDEPANYYDREKGILAIDVPIDLVSR